MMESLEEFLKDAERTTFFQDVQRSLWINEMKGTYSRDYCLSMGITSQEYEKADGSVVQERKKREAESAFLMTQVVGAEGTMPDYW